MANSAQLSAVTKVLEYAWSEIQKKHEDVRDAVMVVYLHSKGDRRGHYAPESWTVAGTGEERDAVDEVHISSHILSQGARSVMETLVHEAVHSAARARGVKDTSRQGRWHNKRFASLAVEFGLMVERDSKIGHVTPDLENETVDAYEETIMWVSDQCGDLFQTFAKKQKKTRKANTVKVKCPDCGRFFRIGTKQLEIGALACVPCGTEFEVVEN